ncbi:hypothetical protein TcWFU_007463 [Taenia crassiceps]|uniref:Uncharacterized protein n=1 Tax=Taenia crassiceps TaxID=6207 RepID=A0ABR4Q011_9CEST
MLVALSWAFAVSTEGFVFCPAALSYAALCRAELRYVAQRWPQPLLVVVAVVAAVASVIWRGAGDVDDLITSQRDRFVAANCKHMPTTPDARWDVATTANRMLYCSTVSPTVTRRAADKFN